MLFTGSPDDSEDYVMGPQRFRYTVPSEPLELFDSQSSALLIAPPRPDDKLSAIIAHRLLQDCVFVDDECACSGTKSVGGNERLMEDKKAKLSGSL